MGLRACPWITQEGAGCGKRCGGGGGDGGGRGEEGDTGLVTSEPGARGGARPRGGGKSNRVGAHGKRRSPHSHRGLPGTSVGAKFPTKFPRTRHLLRGDAAPRSRAPRNKGGAGPPPRGSPSTYRLRGGGGGTHEEQQEREQAGGGHGVAVWEGRAGEWPPSAAGPPYRRWPAPPRPASGPAPLPSSPRNSPGKLGLRGAALARGDGNPKGPALCASAGPHRPSHGPPGAPAPLLT